MVCDLYYFYESDLDRTNIKEFYENLPCHLQSKFRASLHGIQIAKGNVLQGYRGPSNMRNGGSGDSQELQPSQGLQEIKFWWGARKDMNFVPVIGTGLFLLERGWQSLTDELEWSSLFFDSETGECLGHDRREAAKKLKSRRRKIESNARSNSFNHDRGNANENREEYYFDMMTAQDEAHAENLNFQGDQLFDRDEYIDARDKYEEAFNASKQYDQRMKYKRNIRKAQAEIHAQKRYYEGNRLFQMGRFRQAEEEYNTAYVISKEPYARQIYRNCEEKAHIEGYALPFVHEGDNLFIQGRFKEAISRYERALDISQSHEIIRIYRANIDQAHREIEAINSNSKGDNLFYQCRYWEARDEYEKAYNLSKVHEGIYKANVERARVEDAALQLNVDGVHLFKQGKFNEAVGMYQLACNKSQVGAQIQKYKANIAQAQVEIDALKLNAQGDSLFNVGKYNDAVRMYLESHSKSKVSAQSQKYNANADRAKSEVDAANFNSQGDNFFNEGKFNDALSKYQLACQTSQVAAQIQKYKANIAKAQVEIDALKLNTQGNIFYHAGRYNEAVKIYLEAHAKSQVGARSQQYKAHSDSAKAEIDAANFNLQGDNFLNGDRFNDAVTQYQLACNTSRVAAHIQKYRDNIAKAQAEIEALNLDAQGNNFYHAGRYNDAVSMYLEAYNKSETTNKKNMYLSNKNKTQDVINKLNTLDTLWKQAWDVENDSKTDRSAEAKDLFQKILSESEKNLKTFPGNNKFEQFKALAALKIEGNELFNEGINSQENGLALLEEAQELNQQEKYQLANQKFKEAKKYFQEALEKFEKGSESDQRFAACVGFVQDFINEVVDSIKITEQRMIIERLDKLEITGDNHSGEHSRETNVTGKDINYSQHI